jgi:hypothetical protein
MIAPALAHFGIEPIRSDRLAESGKISDQMYRAIFEYDGRIGKDMARERV